MFSPQTKLQNNLEVLDGHSRVCVFSTPNFSAVLAAPSHCPIPCRPSTRRLTRCVLATKTTNIVGDTGCQGLPGWSANLRALCSVDPVRDRTPSCASVPTTRKTTRPSLSSSRELGGTLASQQPSQTAKSAAILTVPRQRLETQLGGLLLRSTTRSVRGSGSGILPQS